MLWLRALPVAVIVLVATGLATASWLRWRRAVRLVAAEPGVVLVDASRSWATLAFSRTQGSHSARSLCRARRGRRDAADDRRRMETVLLLDSAMVVARARQRSLRRPRRQPSSRDTCASAGASIDWLARFANHRRLRSRARRLLGGTSNIAAGNRRVAARLEAERVLFEPGSSFVTDAEVADVRALAATMRQLSDSVTAIGAAARVDLVGRTDPTGTDATNQSLAQLRVDAVMRRLRAVGIPAAMLNGRPLATAQPLRAAAADEQARINRSVSFEAVVTTGRGYPGGRDASEKDLHGRHVRDREDMPRSAIRPLDLLP